MDDLAHQEGPVIAKGVPRLRLRRKRAAACPFEVLGGELAVYLPVLDVVRHWAEVLRIGGGRPALISAGDAYNTLQRTRKMS